MRPWFKEEIILHPKFQMKKIRWLAGAIVRNACMTGRVSLIAMRAIISTTHSAGGQALKQNLQLISQIKPKKMLKKWVNVVSAHMTEF